MLVLLLALVATSSADNFTRLGPNTNFLDTSNWENGELPKAGDIVSFSSSFELFGRELCKNSSTSCLYGGNAVIKPPPSESSVSVSFARLNMPIHGGRLRIANGSRIIFTRIIRYYNGTAVPAGSALDNPSISNISNPIWKSRTSSELDARCALNWGINNTGLNPSFAIPCYQDTVIFPDNTTYMVEVPANTYIGQLVSNTTTNPVVTDPYQYSGYSFQYGPATCPEPFSSVTGVSYCLANCLNTCPEQHPDHVAGLKLQQAQNQTLIGYLQAALSTAKTSQSLLSSAPASISGNITFTAPANTPLSQIQTVASNIMNVLPTKFPFQVTAKCTSLTSSINCNFVFSVSFAQLPAYSQAVNAPYTFIPGLLSIIFTPTVNSMFDQAASGATVSALTAASHLSSLSFVSLSVPSRFIVSLGLDNPSDLITSAITTAINPVSGTYLSVDVLAGATNDTRTLVVYSNYRAVATAAQSLLTNTITVFTVTTADGTVVPVYDANVDSVAVTTQPIGVVNVTLYNSQLYNALPLNDTSLASFLADVQTFVDSQSFGGSLPILAIAVSKQGSSRRTPGVVVLSLAVASTSNLIQQVPLASYGNLYFEGVSSIGRGTTTTTIDQLKFAQIRSELAVQTESYSDATAVVNAELSFLTLWASSNDSVATGTYGWSSLNIVSDSNVAAGLTLTNRQCNDFTAFVSVTSGQGLVKTILAQSMSLVLPVPAGAITFGADIVCGPADSFQTLPDQAALFTVQGVSISAPYTVFASQASYVSIANPSSVNLNLQSFSESSSPLSNNGVRQAIQTSLRIVVLSTLLASYTANVNALTTALTTTTPSTGASGAAAASGSIVVVAAAAGGGVVVLVVVIAVFIVRRRRNARPAKKIGRDTVAFENPMYETRTGALGMVNSSVSGTSITSAHEGLYDEPAFQTQSSKNNPLFGTSTDEDEFGTVINSLQAGHHESLYNEAVGFGIDLGGGNDESEETGDGYLDLQPQDIVVTHADSEVDEPSNNQPLYGHGFEGQESHDSNPIYDNGALPDEAPIRSSHSPYNAASQPIATSLSIYETAPDDAPRSVSAIAYENLREEERIALHSFQPEADSNVYGDSNIDYGFEDTAPSHGYLKTLPRTDNDGDEEDDHNQFVASNIETGYGNQDDNDGDSNNNTGNFDNDNSASNKVTSDYDDVVQESFVPSNDSTNNNYNYSNNDATYDDDDIIPNSEATNSKSVEFDGIVRQGQFIYGEPQDE